MPKPLLSVSKKAIPILVVCFFAYTVGAEDISSDNYIIKGDNISSGSGSGDSSNYGLTGDLNPFSDLSTSENFRQRIGYNPRLEANTPYPAILSNSENYYDRLLIALDDSGNPLDTLYAVIISDNDFSTYLYVQHDGTVGEELGVEDYRSYASWGGGTGSYIIGLEQSTSYKVRVKALQGDFTETGYGSDSNSEKTTVPYVNMSVSNSSITLGTLNINSISQTTSVSIRVNSNAYNGYQVYVHDAGNGSFSGLYNGVSNLIQSVDVTLTAGIEGYGAQANSATAVVDEKYGKVANMVGGLTLSISPLFGNNRAVFDEEATMLFKATIAPTTVSGVYYDVVYFTIAPNI